mmetsp:Transcript_16695/g.47757  ORF Transcript_16695/g.47757 Transcript_16695/m.47757 type:complete len:141 (-) Transcript_16695:239-661(-)
MSKRCDKCEQPYRGFGTTCAPCRKSTQERKEPASGEGVSATPSCDKCNACGKTAYVMERLQVEGRVFHKSCFRCAHCSGKLSLGAFSKGEQGLFYCRPHYEQLFKLRGRYCFTGTDQQHLKQGTAAAAAREEPGAAAVAA